MRRWVFGLGFAIGCGGGETTGDRAAAILALTADVTAGEALYADNCALCHGADGSGGTGSDIRGFAAATTVDAVLVPPDDMTDMSGLLSDQEIADLAGFVETL